MLTFFWQTYISIFLQLAELWISLVNSIFVDTMAADNNDEVLEKLSQLERKLDRMQEGHPGRQ